MRGHVVITAAIHFRGVTIPWAIELWIPKAQAGTNYRKLNEIEVNMIHRFPKLKETKVRVLFDAAYLAVQVTKACESRGFTCIILRYDAGPFFFGSLGTRKQ